MNQVILSGSIYSIKRFDKLVSITLAQQETYNGQEFTHYHSLVGFGHIMDHASNLKKDDQIFVIGKIQTRKSENPKTGNTEYKTNVVISKLSKNVDLDAVEF